MQEHYPSRLKRAGDFVRKFLSEATASIVTTAFIAAGTTAYVTSPEASAPVVPQKPDVAVLHKPELAAAAMPFSPAYRGLASMPEPSATNPPAGISAVPLPPRRPRIVASPLRTEHAAVDPASPSQPLLASFKGQTSVLPAERVPSSTSLLAPPDFDQPGREHGIADLYGTVPIDQLTAVLPFQMYKADADSVLVSAMANAKHRSADVLQSVRGWGSSMIDKLTPD